ncbi:MAG: TIGR00645 family protein [Hyphomonadaceae bacterium]|nr:TIGR00645 family protein [Hyphomonadaceae bacterium]
MRYTLHTQFPQGPVVMTEDNRAVENQLERTLAASRWLLAPFFVGLALSIVILLIKFVQEFYHLAAKALTVSEAEAILGILSLVDLALTGALVMIVIFSGYENFVSKIDHTHVRNWPEWMGSIDFTALKIKLLGSIVAISAIQLLKQFMAVKTASDRDLIWYVVIHVVFVASSVLLALSDRLSGEIKPKPPAAARGEETTKA